MAFKAAEPHGLASRPRGRRRGLLVFAGVAALAIAGLVVIVTVWSGATLSGDPTALARVELQPLAGTLVRAEAFGPDGLSIPVAVHDGRLTPLEQVTPGELISVDVTIRRPGWLGWALGSERLERLTIRAPVARVSNPWLTVAPGSPVRVSFDQPVSTVAYGSGGYLAVHQTPASAVRTVSLGVRDGPGTLEIAAAVRPWEKLSAPVAVTWFPPSRSPVMVASPAPGTQISPTAPIQPDVLAAGRATARLDAPAALAEHARIVARDGHAHAGVHPVGLWRAARQRAACRAAAGRGGHAARGGLARGERAVRVDGAARLDAAPAATARAGGLPPRRLELREPAGRAHRAPRGDGRGRSALRDVQLALPAHAA